LDFCRAMIRPDERGEKIYEFVDNGFSGGNLDRAGFKEMLELIKRGGISRVIVYRLDRISRSLSDFVSIMEQFKKYNVAFVSSQESFDTSTSYGEMITKLLMVFAEFERQSIIERVTHAYQARSDQGIFMGGKCPYGFAFEDTVIHGVKTKRYVSIVNEISHIRYIFDRYAVPNVTLRRLQDDLIQNGLLPTEGNWSTARLSAIIRNPIYVKADNDIYEFFLRKNVKIVSDISEFDGIHGVQIYGKTKHTAEDWSDMKAVVMTHEGVIPSDLWLACQKKVLSNKRIGNSISNETSWLGGMIACKKCGRTMTVTKGGKRADGSQTRYFSCTGKQNRICEGTVTVYADSLEEMADTLIGEKLLSLKTCRKKTSADNSAKINSLKNRIAEIRASEDKLVSLMLDGNVGADMLALLSERAKRFSEEKRELTEKIEALEDTMKEVSGVVNFAEKWKTAAFEEKKAVCHLLIEKIYIDGDGTTEVVWKI
jgi:DNA invertase Pin-like site-specific DNA recombinase